MLKKKILTSYLDKESEVISAEKVKTFTKDVVTLVELEKYCLDSIDKVNEQQNIIDEKNNEIENLSLIRPIFVNKILGIFYGLFIFATLFFMTASTLAVFVNSFKFEDSNGKNITEVFEKYRKNKNGTMEDFNDYMLSAQNSSISEDLKMDIKDVEMITYELFHNKRLEERNMFIKILAGLFILGLFIKFYEKVKYFKKFNLDLIKENETLKLYEIELEKNKVLYHNKFVDMQTINNQNAFYKNYEVINVKEFSNYAEDKLGLNNLQAFKNKSDKFDISFQENITNQYMSTRKEVLDELKNNLSEWEELIIFCGKLK